MANLQRKEGKGKTYTVITNETEQQFIRLFDYLQT